MMCILGKKSEYRRKRLLLAKTGYFFLFLIFAFTLLTACSESPPGNVTTPASEGNPPSENNQVVAPIQDNEAIEVIEEKVFVGLPEEREDRFSLAYTRAEDLSLNPFRDGQTTDIFQPQNFIYEKLLHYNKSEGIYESGILEKIELSNRQFTLHLKSGLSFHNGFNLLANDVLQTFILYQSSGHVLGRTLDEAVVSYSMTDDLTLEITITNDDDAVFAVFDCLEKIPILPYQLWSAHLPAGSDLTAFQEMPSLPTVGSGPYRVIRQDDFVLILEKFTSQPSYADFEDYPQYLIYYKYQQENLAMAALAYSDIDVLLSPEDTHPLKAVDDTLHAFANMHFWETNTADNYFSLPVQEKRMGIALNPASAQLQDASARKFVQSIMLRLNDTQQSLYPNISNINSLPAGNQLSLPSILSADLTKEASRLLPGTSSQMTNSYLAESSWSKNLQSGLIVDENDETVELNFYYPASTTRLSIVCRQLATIANNNGLSVIAKEISVEEWQMRLQTHDYDLIYMESVPDESIPQMIARVKLWSGLESDSEMEDSSNFAAKSGRHLLQKSTNDALSFNSITAHLLDLNTFLIENNLFIPLGIAYKTGGIGNEMYFTSKLTLELKSH